MRHIIYIDPLEKLNLKKDSSLLFALSLKEMGHEPFIVFENDLAWINHQNIHLSAYEINGAIQDDFYLKEIALGAKHELELNASDKFWMRLDPPFDSRYLRVLWLLDILKNKGIEVLNDPRSIMCNNEKLIAYQKNNAVDSYVGMSDDQFVSFIAKLKQKRVAEIVLKPLDLYSGIGVSKHQISEDLLSVFQQKKKDFGGMIVAQAFIPEVRNGEMRIMFWQGKHLASILKKPKAGEFISNIAQGAKFEIHNPSQSILKRCEEIAMELNPKLVPWIAFDALGEQVTEANITCPGLLVELSHAHGRNLAHEMIKSF